MPERNAMELLSRHADQPGAAGDLRGGWLSGPKDAPHSQTLMLGPKQNWPLEKNDAEQLLGDRMTIRLLAVAIRCRPRGTDGGSHLNCMPTWYPNPCRESDLNRLRNRILH